MAIRGKIQRVRSNDGKALVFVTPDMVRAENEQPESSESMRPVSSAPELRPDPELVHAIKATRDQLTAAAERETRLVAQLAAVEARAEKQAVEFTARGAERLSRDSLAIQRIAVSDRIQVGDGVMDVGVEAVEVGEGSMRKVARF